jgi:hypothetical protein
MSKRLSATVVALALACTQAAQAADPIATSSFELSTLAYSLKSLDLTGQSTPGFRFELVPGVTGPGTGTGTGTGTTGQLGFAAGAFSVPMTGEVKGLLTLAPGVLPTGQASQASANGLASYAATPDAIRGSVSVNAAQLAQELASRPREEGLRVGAGIDSVIDQPWRIVLAPHTSITWSGHITQHVTVNELALRAQLAPYHDSQTSTDVMLFSSVSLAMTDLDPGLLAANPDPSVGSYLDASFSYDPAYIHTPQELPADQAIDLRPFSFTLVNTLNVAAGGTFYLSAVSGFGVAMSSNAPVPEPATWALMGLGLAGLGWASRGRRPTA